MCFLPKTEVRQSYAHAVEVWTDVILVGKDAFATADCHGSNSSVLSISGQRTCGFLNYLFNFVKGKKVTFKKNSLMESTLKINVQSKDEFHLPFSCKNKNLSAVILQTQSRKGVVCNVVLCVYFVLFARCAGNKGI
jgi:hypothetical protein